MEAPVAAVLVTTKARPTLVIDNDATRKTDASSVLQITWSSVIRAQYVWEYFFSVTCLC